MFERGGSGTHARAVVWKLGIHFKQGLSSSRGFWCGCRPVRWSNQAIRPHTLSRATSLLTKAGETMGLIFSYSCRDAESTLTSPLTVRSFSKLVHLWERRGLERMLARSSGNLVYISNKDYVLLGVAGACADPVRWSQQVLRSHTFSLKPRSWRQRLGKGWDWSVPLLSATLHLMKPTLSRCEDLINWRTCEIGEVLVAC